jgi:hypothetical protein
MKISQRTRYYSIGLTVALLIAGWACPAFGQATVTPRGPGRLAAGVLTTILPDVQASETVSEDNIKELKDADPSFDFAQNVRFRRDIWYLELRFKPVRMIWVDIPQADGHMKRKLIWYMVYSVTNQGTGLTSVTQPDKTTKVEPKQQTVHFIPEFILRANEFDKEYSDRVIPLALGPIAARERMGSDLLNTVTMPKSQIAVGDTRWGVAMWENIDPRVDFFSIYVTGLTNAYRWQDPQTPHRPGVDPIAKGRRFARKTLKLNFWRPGDEYFENEKEIRYGIPGQVDYEWVYR